MAFYTAEDDKADALGIGAAVSCAFDFIYKNDICTDTFARGNDILVLRSRGATKLQVFILYLQQSGIIAIAGCVLGIVLGYIMCRAAASTDGF